MSVLRAIFTDVFTLHLLAPVVLTVLSMLLQIPWLAQAAVAFAMTCMLMLMASTFARTVGLSEVRCTSLRSLAWKPLVYALKILAICGVFTSMKSLNNGLVKSLKYLMNCFVIFDVLIARLENAIKSSGTPPPSTGIESTVSADQSAPPESSLTDPDSSGSDSRDTSPLKRPRRRRVGPYPISASSGRNGDLSSLASQGVDLHSLLSSSSITSAASTNKQRTLSYAQDIPPLAMGGPNATSTSNAETACYPSTTSLRRPYYPFTKDRKTIPATKPTSKIGQDSAPLEDTKSNRSTGFPFAEQQGENSDIGLRVALQ